MKSSCLLHFSKPGLLTSVQDQGRQHYPEFGVPIGGAMDRKSSALANWLVGNKPSNPVLEVTLLGPTFSVEGNCQMALTGADLTAQMNGQPIPMNETIDVSSGSIVSFGKNKWGCRTYLAIGGTWKVLPWLDSVSAMPFNSEWVTPDSIIQSDGYLKIETRPGIKLRSFQKDVKPSIDGARIRLLPGPEFNLFSP